MKKLLMVCCFVVSIVSLSKAQGGGGGGRMQRSPADQVKQIQTAIPNLTADQSTKILNIYTAAAASRDSAMKAGADRASMRPMMMATQTKIMTVLTADQQATYKKYMADQAAQRQQNGGGGGMGGGGNPPPPSEKE